MKYLAKNIISETEQTLMNLAEQATNLMEIEQLISFPEYRNLQKKLWAKNHLDPDFIKLWLLHYSNNQMSNKEYCLNDILLRPIYDVEKCIRLWCGFIVDDQFRDYVLRKYYCELRDNEYYIDLMKTNTDDRLYFEIDELAVNIGYLTNPHLSTFSGIYFPKHDYYEFQKFITTEDEIKKIRNLTHPQIVNANFTFHGNKHFYTNDIISEAIELCEDKECLKILLSDEDQSIAEMSKMKLLKLNLNKKDVDKMLADSNENVRIVGLQILHDINI